MISLENGKKVEISAPENSDSNRYIRSMQLNGRKYTRNYLDHTDLTAGARLYFDMDDRPSTGRGTAESDLPYSFSREGK